MLSVLRGASTGKYDLINPAITPCIIIVNCCLNYVRYVTTWHYVIMLWFFLSQTLGPHDDVVELFDWWRRRFLRSTTWKPSSDCSGGIVTFLIIWHATRYKTASRHVCKNKQWSTHVPVYDVHVVVWTKQWLCIISFLCINPYELLMPPQYACATL